MEETVQEKKKSGLGTAGMVLGIIGICFSVVPEINYIAFILGILALIFSSISLAKKASKGKAIAGLVLSLLTILFSIITITSMDETTSNEILTNANVEEKFTLESSEHTSDMFSDYIEGTIKNNTNKKYSYVEVKFTVFDKNGNQLGTAWANVNNLEPNGTWKYKAMALVSDDVASYKLESITGW